MNSRKERMKKVLCIAAIPLMFAAGYLVLIKITGFSLQCPLHRLTGLYCPLCGATRMLQHLAHLDFAGAFSAHPVLFCLLFPAGGVLICRAARYIQSGKTAWKQWEKAILTVCTLIFTILGFMRNLSVFSYLAPH